MARKPGLFMQAAVKNAAPVHKEHNLVIDRRFVNPNRLLQATK
jgi:hypothetical protein